MACIRCHAVSVWSRGQHENPGPSREGKINVRSLKMSGTVGLSEDDESATGSPIDLAIRRKLREPIFFGGKPSLVAEQLSTAVLQKWHTRSPTFPYLLDQGVEGWI